MKALNAEDMALAPARAASDTASAVREGLAYARQRGWERTCEGLLAVCRLVALSVLTPVTGSLIGG